MGVRYLHLRLKRDSIRAPHEVSDCFYSLVAVETAEYWPHKQPAYLVRFRKAVTALETRGYFASEIPKVNYPFDYKSMSSF